MDFSERSIGAARYAKSLASHFASELTLLHVLTPPQYEFGAVDIGGSMIAELYRSRQECAARDLDAFLVDEWSGVNVRRELREGDPAHEIVELAHQCAGEVVIIMPTHGYGTFRRFILGSNTAKVLHDADCPVWTGVHLEKPPTPAAIPFQNVLCAVDLGPQSSRTLCWAAMLAGAFGARLTMVHAISPGTEASSVASMHDAAQQELARLRSFVSAETDTVVEAGDPATLICSVADRLPADVLIIGRGSAAGVFGRLRTNAYAIIRQSPCPVVSV